MCVLGVATMFSDSRVLAVHPPLGACGSSNQRCKLLLGGPLPFRDMATYLESSRQQLCTPARVQDARRNRTALPTMYHGCIQRTALQRWQLRLLAAQLRD